MSESAFFAFTFPCGQHQGFGTLFVHRFGFIIEVLTEYLPAGTEVKYSSAVDREWHGAHAFVFAFFGKEWPERVAVLSRLRSGTLACFFAAWLQVPPPPGFSAFLDLCSLHS